MKRTLTVAALAAALLLAGCGARGFDESTAWSMCQERVSAQLRSPSTAQFPSTSEIRWTKNIRTYKFPGGYVDAQNGFGATVRTYFDCTVMQRAEGSSDAEVTVRF